jgi:adenylate cyclase
MRRVPRLGTLAGPVLLGLALALWRALAGDPLTDGIENRLIDLRFVLRGPVAAPTGVAVVGVDEAAIDRLGWTPPPRAAFAKAIAVIAAARPKIIIVDLLMLDPTPADPDVAAVIAVAQAAGVPVVLGAAVSFPQSGAVAADPPRLSPSRQAAVDRSSMTALSVAPPGTGLPRLFLPADDLLTDAMVGHVNLSEGGDRAARRLPLAQWAGGGVFLPSLSLLGGLALRDLRPGDAVILAGGSVRVGDSAIGTRPAGEVAINHYGPPGTLATFGLLDVLDGKVPREALAGKAVFVGATAESLTDLFATPFGAAVPGVEVLATAAANVATGAVPREGAQAGTIWYALAPVAAALLLLAARARSPVMALGVGLLVWAGALGSLQAAFTLGNRLPDATAPVLALFAATAWAVWWRMTDDRRRAARLTAERANLARYVSPFLAEELARTRVPRFNNRTQNAAILFVDVAGYTTLSEALTPEATSDVVRGVQAFYEDCATRHRGVLASFQGDGVMIVFGLPVPDSGDAGRALACGRDLLAGIGDVPPPKDRPGPLHIRVSIHFGPVVAGIVGGASHAQVTVNGDTVNIASRLQDVAKDRGADFIVSSATLDAAGATEGFRPLGPAPIRGRSETVDVWAAL